MPQPLGECLNTTHVQQFVSMLFQKLKGFGIVVFNGKPAFPQFGGRLCRAGQPCITCGDNAAAVISVNRCVFQPSPKYEIEKRLISYS